MSDNIGIFSGPWTNPVATAFVCSNGREVALPMSYDPMRPVYEVRDGFEDPVLVGHRPMLTSSPIVEDGVWVLDRIEFSSDETSGTVITVDPYSWGRSVPLCRADYVEFAVDSLKVSVT